MSHFFKNGPQCTKHIALLVFKMPFTANCTANLPLTLAGIHNVLC